MVRAVYIGLLLALVWIQGASAEPAIPSCERLRAAYDQLTSAPISAEDGSLSIAVNALADGGFMWTDRTYTQQSTREDIAEHLKKLPPLDALIWVFHRYDELELYLFKHCGFKQTDHKDIRLMNPKPVTPTCKAPAELPKKLLK
ncbi:MAG: hypothetical protein KBD06_04245 [Candidatus Pacebacteria bacterium]|nr:hypothetical protein [Candidatus Paceibacterota bacterium]